MAIDNFQLPQKFLDRVLIFLLIDNFHALNLFIDLSQQRIELQPEVLKPFPYSQFVFFAQPW